MAQGKQTPRQKMINLMYLVFIAMMALNIDAEIIRSYYESTKSLNETRLLTEEKNTGIFEETLKAKAETVPDTYAEPYEQYKVLKNKIDALVGYVENIKTTLKKESEFSEKTEDGKPIDLSESFSQLNNNEIPTRYFFAKGEEGKPTDNAKKMMAMMDDVRNYINKTFANNGNLKSLVDRANKSLITEYKQKNPIEDKSWLQNKFYHQSLIATLSNLEIIQNDARNVQSDALALMLREKVDATIKFNNYDAVVKAPVDVVQGTKAEATVYLASYSNSDKIKISGVSQTENGKGIIGLNTSGLGTKTLSGTITVSMADGKPLEIPYTHTYNVIAGQKEVQYETGAVVTADKMNVMYRGLENPISGAILGVDNSKLSLTAQGAKVKSTGPGKWTVVPGTGNLVKVTISGTGPRGTTSKTFDFRIKNVPPPNGQIRGKNVLSMPASSISNQIVTVALPDFDFPVSFNVTSFLLKVPGRAAIPVTGNSLESVRGAVSNLRSGDVVSIYAIKYTAQGIPVAPGREASSIQINVQ
ncbi:type IX secretion system motor protein PorM/GldM [Bergeyella zoohelcum]|uniref:Gliding motility-associated protein GldM n=1 Tax=Bergeyella zoohelcum TaxID=1015 RepID=A0A7Z9CF36_9FLAO|nr:GldM family protein [Bergeyella zoohelcum]VDH02874.1 gliding motility-associated protein GldM [Bergeyella zoohelcum]